MKEPRIGEKSSHRRATKVFLFVGVVILLGPAYIAVHSDMFLSFGGSAPRGFWSIVEHDANQPYTIGSWVIVCPPLSAIQHRQLFAEDPPVEGSCKSKLSLKRIAAVPGDRVVVKHPQVITPLITVESVSHNLQGDPLPRPTNGEYTVAHGTYWVINPHPRSVDSRYYGPINRSAIDFGALPLWTVP